MANNLFTFLGSLIEQPDHRLLLQFSSHDKEKGELTASVSVFDGKEAPLFKPLVLRGTYDDFANQQNGFWVSIRDYQNEVLSKASNLDALKKEVEEAEKKHKKALEKANKPVEVKKNRCVGGTDSGVLLILVSGDMKNEEFKKALGEANLQTILTGLNDLSIKPKEKGRFTKLSAELKKITGHNAEDQEIIYNPDGGEASTEKKSDNTEQSDNRESGEPEVVAPGGMFDFPTKQAEQ